MHPKRVTGPSLASCKCSEIAACSLQQCVLQASPPTTLYDIMVGAFGEDLAMKMRQAVGGCNISSIDLVEADRLPTHTPDMLMPNCLPVPGVCHLSHNTAVSVTSRMSHWEEYWRELKNTEALLTNPDHMRVVIHRCVTSGPHHAAEAAFKKSPPKMYEKRWSVISLYIQAAWPQLLVLKHVWFPDRHGGARKESASVFDTQLFERTMQSTLFFGYTRMVMLLHSHIDAVPGWAESCSCHAAPGLPSFRAACLKRDFKGHTTSNHCPLANMRLPGLVAMMLQLPGSETPGFCSADVTGLFLHTSAYMSMQEWEVIHRDYAIACDTLQMELVLKLGFAKLLPWALCGLAHDRNEVAVKVAQHCLKLYDEMSDAQRHCLPCVAQAFLARENEAFAPARAFRSDLERVAQGSPVTACSGAFVLAVASLRFCPLSERTVEAGHARVKKGHGYNKVSPASASAHLRFGSELLQPMIHDVDFFERLSNQLERSRKLATVAKSLHLTMHPQLLALSTEATGRQHTKLLPFLSKVLYRCDAASVFKDLSMVKREHGQEVIRMQSEAMKQFQQREPLSIDAIIAHYLTEHLRSVLEVGCVVAFPSSLGAVHPLEMNMAYRSLDARDIIVTRPAECQDVESSVACVAVT